MNCLGFTNIVSATGTLTSLSAATDGGTGIVLTPDPIIENGTIGLVVDLKADGTNIALGSNNWTGASPSGDNNLTIGNSNMFNLMGNDNIVLGHNLQTIDFSEINDSIVIGHASMDATLISTSDIVIGSNNIQQMGNSNNNLVIGHNNLTNATIAGNNNICIGRRNNQNVNESIDNIVIGRDIEFVSTDKRECIVIGRSITVPSETTSNTTVIGGFKTGLNGIPAPTYSLESTDSRCMHNFYPSPVFDFRYMEFLNSGALNMVGVDINVFNFDLNTLQFPAGPGFRMLTLEIIFTCTYFVEPGGYDPADVYNSNSCTLGLIYNSQTTTWNVMQKQSGYQQPSTNVDCNNNNNQVVFNMAVPYVDIGVAKFIPYQIAQHQLFLSGANNSTMTYNIQMNTTLANSGLGRFSCMYKFYTAMGVD